MKRLKAIVAAIGVMLFLTLFGLWLKMWPTDPRLHGTFRSDQEETINRLLSTKSISTEKLKVLRQMYGHMTYTFDGHKIKANTDPHVVQNYPKGSKTEVEQETLEAYFLLKKDRGERACLIVIPTPLWRLNDIQVLNIEFDINGFWLKTTAILGNGPPEKFTKI